MWCWTRVAVAAGCAVVALAACGSEHAGQSQSALTTRASAAESPAQRAAADAVSLLAAFRPPAGATQSGPLTVPVLAQEDQPIPSDVVTRTRWYRAPGQPLAVLAWVTEHCPSGLMLAGSGGQGWIPVRCGSARQLPQPRLAGIRPGTHFPPVWDDMFSGAAGELEVSVAADGPGKVAIRLDAQAAWLPARPAAERLPAAARVVTITHVPGSEPQPAGDAPVTITNPPLVARIAAIVDALPVFPPGIASCLLSDGSGMRLTFRATPSGPALAEVTAQTDGCESVAVTIGGKSMPTLAQSASLQQQVATVVGLHWPAGQLPAGRATPTAAPTAMTP
jgi:hypothetical protein